MKKYRNIIILFILAASVTTFLVIQYVNFNELFLVAGIYDQKINIINTADVHGHIVFDPDESGYYSEFDKSIIMGLPLIDSIIKDVKQNNSHTILLDSGDLFHGTSEANIEDGKGVVEIVNKMGYAAMTPGNHDFNFGFERLLEIESQLNFPVLSANIYKDGELVFDEYKVLEVGGKKIGLFGLTTPFSIFFINSEDHDNISFEDSLTAAKRVVSTLKEKENADIIILMSHLGDDKDEQIVKELDGIDLILCGHYHNLYNSVKKINNTYLAEAGSWTTHVGIASIYLKDGKVSSISWEVKNSQNTEGIDAELDEISQKYHEIALKDSSIVLGVTNVRLNGLRSEVRSKETNLANLLTDAMKDAGKADIAIMNGGGIRQSLQEGDIDLYNLGKILPFSNSLVTVEMSGEKIYKAIERGLQQYPDIGNGGFLQVSGISYTFDASKPIGQRVVSITKEGVPLDKEQTYRVATNDYLFNGGDGYSEFKESELVEAGELLKNVLARYIEQKKIVEPVLEGRITVINERYK